MTWRSPSTLHAEAQRADSVTPERREHPYLFFGPGDIERLRDARLEGRAAEAWRNVRRVSRRRLHWKPYMPPRPVPPGPTREPKLGPGRWWDDYDAAYVEHYRLAMMIRNLSELHAIVSLLDDDSTQRQAALKWALFPCRWEQRTWDAYGEPERPISSYTEFELAHIERSGGALVDRRRAADGTELGRFADTGMFTTFKLRGLAVALDWLGPQLSATERDLLTSTIAAQCERLYAEALRGHGLLIPHMLNHTWVDVAGFGLAALSLYWDHPAAPGWVQFARDKFVEHLLPGTIGRDGEFPEPGPYVWEYALMNAGLFFEALRRVTGEDLLAHPAMQRVPNFLIGLLNPRNGLGFDEDMTGFDRGEGMLQAFRPLALRLASHHGNGQAQWFACGEHAGELGAEGGKLYPGGHWFPEEREYHGYWEFLWYDQSVTPQPPEPCTLRHFRDTGYVVMRSGRSPEDTFLVFRSGSFLGPHDRNDQNKFVLYAKGERLVEHLYGPNYGFFEYFKNTPGSNTVLVDGLGQPPVEQGLRHTQFETEYKSDDTRGRILRAESGDVADYVIGDATRAYAGRLARFTRTIVFVKPDLFVVIDDLASAGEPAHFEWLLHSAGDIDAEGTEAFIRKPSAWLHVRALLPRPCRWDVARTPLDNFGRTLPRHLTLSPVEAARETRFVTVLAPVRPDETPPASRLDLDGSQLIVTINHARRAYRVAIDPSQAAVRATAE